MEFAFGLFLSVLSAASAAALPVDPNKGVAATQARVELLLEDLFAALEGLLTDEDEGFDLEAERRELEEELERLEEWFRKDKEEITRCQESRLWRAIASEFLGPEAGAELAADWARSAEIDRGVLERDLPALRRDLEGAETQQEVWAVRREMRVHRGWKELEEETEERYPGAARAFRNICEFRADTKVGE